MSIDSISLAALSSYTKIQNQPKIIVEDSQMTEAVNFHKMVDKQFNNFSKMSPTQILTHIKGARHASSIASSSGTTKGVVQDTVATLRKSLKKQEDLSRKSLIGEASLIDILTATTEAKTTMDILVKVRSEFMTAFDKVMNMSM